VDEHGGPATIRGNWEENFQQIAPFIGRTLSPEARDTIHGYVARFLADQASLLERRVAQRRIRDGHGDLHAGSVCATRRRLYLFDCIEFNPRFRCSDVASEVAFLSMDLAHLGRADLGHALVDAYVRASGDRELRDLLAFYTCYRAFVRGKVLSFRLDQPAVGGSGLAAIGAEAGAYFDLAWAAAGGLRGPMLVVTMGLPASGKTTLARGLAGRFGFVHLSSDVVRKRLVGLGATEHRRERFGRGLYSRANSQRTYAVLRRQAMGWLRQGQSVVLDATYGQPHERVALRRLAQQAGVPLVVLVCQADEATLRARLAARPSDSLTTSDARLSLWPALRAAYVEPCEWSEAVGLDTTRPPDVSLTDALSVIRRARPPLSA
jgi:predicted kinase